MHRTLITQLLTLSAVIASLCLITSAQEENYYNFGAPQARFVPNYQQPQNEYINQNINYRQQGYQEIDSYLPQRDLQTSDLPVHLQQTLPQYRFPSITTKEPAQPARFNLQQYQGTGNQPQPFRPQPNNNQFAQNIVPSTHRPNYSHLFKSHNHNPSEPETFLGEIKIQSPADLPPEFTHNASPFRPSGNFPLQNPVAEQQQAIRWNEQQKTKSNEVRFPEPSDAVDQNLDYMEKPRENHVGVGNSNRGNFLNHRTRIFAPNGNENIQDTKQTKDYFVNSEGEVYGTKKAKVTTTPIPATTLHRRFPFKFNDLLSTTELTIRRTRRPTTSTESSFDIDSLLEDPEDEIDTSKHKNDVEVIQSVTLPPDQFFTLPSVLSTENSQESSPEVEEYDDEFTTDYDYENATTDEPVSTDENTSTSDNASIVNNASNIENTSNIDNISSIDNASNVDNDFNDEATNQLQDDEEPANYKQPNESFINNINNSLDATTDNIESPTENTRASTEKAIIIENVSEVASSTTERVTTIKDDKNYDVLTMKPSTMVKDDNFKGFVDSTVIDTTEEPHTTSVTKDDVVTEIEKAHEIMLEPVVSFVTTKSVVNNTIIGTVTPNPKPTEQMSSPTQSTFEDTSDTWVVVASVQTSRSVSGARYLPSPIVEQDVRTKLLNENGDEEIEAEDMPIETTSSNPSEETTVDHTIDYVNATEEIPTTTSPKPKTSTESLIDKLDRVQSDLSSGLLTGGFNNGGNNITVITEGMNDTSSGTTMIDLETTTVGTTTIKTVVPPVVIKKFSPDSRPPRPTYKPKYQTRPKTTAKSAVDLELPQGDEPDRSLNETTGRSSGISIKNTVVVQDVSKFLPKGYKPPADSEDAPKTIEDILRNAKTETPEEIKTIGDIEVIKVDVSSLLPKGYKPPTEEEPENKKIKIADLIKTIKEDDISALLPPGYKTFKTTSTENPKPILDIFKKAEPVDISALLPPGYKLTTDTSITTSTKSPLYVKLTTTEKSKGLFKEAAIDDISAFLPPGYKARYTPKFTTTVAPSEEPVQNIPVGLLPAGYKPPAISVNASSEMLSSTTSTTPSSNFKIVFPSRPGVHRKSGTGRLTTPRSSYVDGGPSIVTSPSIHKGWPSRAPTEFTGWPTPSTTPISIEKLLEAARAAATAASITTSSTTTTTTSTTTTTTTTTQKPTTPGICVEECDLAGTIKLVGGAKWVPELLDRNTKEWQILANEVQSQLEDVYSKSSVLNKWYKKIRIDGFSEGSVLVDYLVELNDLGREVDTVEIKKLFHESLDDALMKSSNREPKASDLSDEDRKMEGKLGLGNFVVDPKYTDFVVLPKQMYPTVGYAEDSVLLPQWAIAVIVIGLASLLFVIIFGVTVLVNRQKNSKKRQPTPLTEDMLNELNKNHMGVGIDNYGADDLYNMEDVWNDRHPYDVKPKKRSTGSIHDNSMANLYDSWKSEWNGYYYNQYYGNSNNPGSSHGGYGHGNGGGGGNGRRRSDYDTNF